MFRRTLSMPVQCFCVAVALLTFRSPLLLADAPAPPRGLQLKIAPRGQATTPVAPPQFSVGLQLADRQEVIKITRAAEYVTREDYHPALVMLQSVLNGPDNVAKAADKNQRNLLRNIRFEAERMIANLPTAALTTYELLAGGDARHKLDAAVEQQNLEALIAVSSSYLHTQAGYEATLLLAFGYRDQGRPLDAAWCIERALQSRAHVQSATAGLALHAAIAWHAAGDSQRAKAKLHAMKAAAERGKIDVRGKAVEIYHSEGAALPWLTQLIGASHEIPSTAPKQALASAVQNVAKALEEITWQEKTSALDVDATGLPFRARGALDVTRQIQDVEKTLQRENLPAVTLTVPQVSGNTLVLRTPDKLQAREVTTGEVLWEQRYSKPFSQVLTGNVKPLPGDRGSILDPMLRDRIFTNATYNQVTVGDGRVFCISDHGFSGQTVPPNRFPVSRAATKSHPLTTRRFSHLNAISLETGKLLWRVGQEAESAEGEFAGHFFLGAPLLLAGQLYCLAEVQREIHLIVLNPTDGDIQWSRELQGCALPVEQSSYRGHSGLSPRYVDGQLICPGAGAVVAVDGATRQLIWTHRYTEVEDNSTRLRNQRQLMIARIAAMQGKPAPPQPRSGSWLGTDVIASAKHIVLAPRSIDELFCLSALDGSLRWKQPRGDGLFLVNIDETRLLIVGAKTVRLINLQDGKSMWPAPAQVSPPSGTGLLAGGKYHLPLSSHAVAVIDMKTGHLETQDIDTEAPLGNLVWQGGHLVSQRADSVQVHKIAGEPKSVESLD